MTHCGILPMVLILLLSLDMVGGQNDDVERTPDGSPNGAESEYGRRRRRVFDDSQSMYQAPDESIHNGYRNLLERPHPHRRKGQNDASRQRRYEGIVFPGSTSRNMYCYSCMSKGLENTWEYLWHMYRRPEQFSDTCHPEHFRRGLVKLRNCTDYCIWINAEIQVFGHKIPIYTRGCMSDLLNYRQDEPKIRNLRRKDECVRMQLAELFIGNDKKIHNERVELCACHANYCNGAPSGTSMATIRSTLPIVTALFLLLAASGFWRCTEVL